MSSKVCPCTSLPTGVKFVAFGDAVLSIILFIIAFFGVVGLLFLSDSELPVNLSAGQRIFLLFAEFFLGVLGAAQLWAARVLYKYTELSNQSNQNDRGLWQWLLVTAVTIVWFLQAFLGSILLLKVGWALFNFMIIVFKVYGVVVVAAFKKSLKMQETGAVRHENSMIP